MVIIIIVVLVVILLFVAYVAYVNISTTKRIVSAFRSSNVIVYGKKRKGKDLLFQKVINARKTSYFANIPYSKKGCLSKYHHIEVKDLSVSPNTYDNFINGDVSKIDKNKSLEGVDIYLSDAGIILPSQMDSVLHKRFPSFPIFYALSGHLYNNNIHLNTQNLERVWKALREQADYFIRIRKRIWFFGLFAVVFTTEYDLYETAMKNLAPMKRRVLNGYSTAEYDLFNAQNGYVKDGFFLISRKSCHYDTRVYHSVLFGKRSPKSYKKK